MEMVLSDVSSMYRAQDVYELRRFDLFTGNSIQDLEMHIRFIHRKFDSKHECQLAPSYLDIELVLSAS